VDQEPLEIGTERVDGVALGNVGQGRKERRHLHIGLLRVGTTDAGHEAAPRQDGRDLSQARDVELVVHGVGVHELVVRHRDVGNLCMAADAKSASKQAGKRTTLELGDRVRVRTRLNVQSVESRCLRGVLGETAQLEHAHNVVEVLVAHIDRVRVGVEVHRSVRQREALLSSSVTHRGQIIIGSSFDRALRRTPCRN